MKQIKQSKFVKLWFLILVYIATPLIYAVPLPQKPQIEDYDASEVSKEIAQPSDLEETMDELQQFMDEKKQYYAKHQVAEDIEKFVLKSIIIENNVIFSDQELKFSYQDKINKEVEIEDLQEIAKRITEKYQQAGYMLSFAVIPTQEIVDNTLNIVIIEGIIDDVLLVDKTPKEYSKVLFNYAEKLLKTKPMTHSAYSNFLTKANLLPGIAVLPDLIPSPDTFGASTLVLKVKETPINLGFNNTDHVSKRYGPNVNNTQFVYNNISHGIQAGMGYARSSFAHHKKLEANSLFYKHFLGDNGASIDIDYSNNLTKPFFNSEFDVLKVQGHNKNVGFLTSYPLIQTFQKTIAINMGFQFKDNKTFMMNNLKTNDRLRILQFGLLHKFNSDWFNETGNSTVQMDLYQGLKEFGATPSDSTNLSRAGGKTNFTKVNLSVSRLQPLTQNIYIVALLEGQYAFNELLSSEEYSFGGAKLGRGYDSTIISGDQGAAGQLELIYDLHIKPEVTSQLYCSYDIGKIWHRRSLVAIEPRLSAKSIAIGTRIKLFKHFNVDVSMAKPLTQLYVNQDMKTRFFINFSATL